MAMQTAAPPALIDGGQATIFVTDFERAVTFYTRTLGLKLGYRAGNEFATVNAGNGLTIGLHPAGGKHAPRAGAPGGIQVGLTVTQPLEEAVKTLTERGVTFIDSGKGVIVDDGAVRLAFFGDPDGNSLYLCQVMRWK